MEKEQQLDRTTDQLSKSLAHFLNNNKKDFYDKISHGPLGRYASKEMLDRGYESLGSAGSQDRMNTDCANNKSIDRLKSASSL